MEKNIYQSPVIIIGAGRSGSTLLSGILHNHPDISFFSENYFLAPFVWGRVFNEHNITMNCLASMRAHGEKDEKKARAGHFIRLNKLIAKFCYEVMDTDPDVSMWGYKEIWNGSKGFETFEWDIYSKVFPYAKYIHLIRNPIKFALSTGGRDDSEFTKEVFINQLIDWVRINKHTERRYKNADVVLLKYEDLLSNKENELKRVFSSIGLEWNDECMKGFEQKWVPSKRDLSELLSDFLADPIDLPEFKRYVEKYGYKDACEDIGMKFI